jgi:hypothetical protein
MNETMSGLSCSNECEVESTVCQGSKIDFAVASMYPLEVCVLNINCSIGIVGRQVRWKTDCVLWE